VLLLFTFLSGGRSPAAPRFLVEVAEIPEEEARDEEGDFVVAAAAAIKLLAEEFLLLLLLLLCWNAL
jgi:hypothetical protein